MPVRFRGLPVCCVRAQACYQHMNRNAKFPSYALAAMIDVRSKLVETVFFFIALLVTFQGLLNLGHSHLIAHKHAHVFQNGASGRPWPNRALRSKLGSHNQNGTAWLLRCSCCCNGLCVWWRMACFSSCWWSPRSVAVGWAWHGVTEPQRPPKRRFIRGLAWQWLAVLGVADATMPFMATQAPFCTITTASKGSAG